MKTEKVIVPLAVSAAVVIAGIAAIVVTNNRAAVARANAVAAEMRESEADKRAKEAKSNEVIANKNSQAARDAKAKVEAELEIKIAEKEKAVADAKAAEASAVFANAQAAAARDNAARERDAKESVRLKAEAAKAELDKENARIAGELALSNAAVAEARAKLETEKRRTEAEIAREKLLTLAKIRFEKWERELIEFKQELDERERALHPDVSIFDSSNITWVADREADVIGAETNRLVKAKYVRMEDDPQLPSSTRKLARADRLAYESRTNRVAQSREKIIATLEKLRDAAVREGRVTDAKFYQKSINSLYPNYQDCNK